MDARADDEFVAKHEPFVRKLALRVRDELDLTTGLEDLMGYGFRGLLEARQRFDPERGVPFTSYAYYRVRGSIIDGVRLMARLPRHTYAHRKAAEALDASAEHQATERAAPRELGSTLRAIDDILGKTSAAFVISAVGQAERAPPEPDAALIASEERARVDAALRRLPERERAVIEGHYLHDRTIEELGASMGISKSWASRLHTRGLGMLRDALGRSG